MAKRRRSRQDKRIYPMPEGLLPGPWTVKASETPSVDLSSRVMEVSLDDTDIAAYGRAHEMVHVKITPPAGSAELCAKHGISFVALQCIEDMRVHDFMSARNIPRPAYADKSTLLDKIRPIAKNAKMLVSLLCATRFCEQSGSLTEAICESSEIDNCSEIISLYELLCEVYDHFKGMQYRDKPVTTLAGFETLTVPIAKLFDELFAGNGDQPQAIDPREYATRYGTDYASRTKWGEMFGPQKIPLSVPRKNRKGLQRTWRDEGVMPVAMHRLPVDGRVFSRRRKDRGGTVLIDASGSMSFSSQDLADVIATAPGATIGVYAGDRTMGRLVIVAANGRMADRDEIDKALSVGADGELRGAPMHGNVVDGPALRWLARQASPRIWYSDGGVTGEYDRTGFNLMVEVNQIAREADIERVSNWREALDALR